MVFDNGRRSKNGGILWDLKPGQPIYSPYLKNEENNIVLPSENPLTSIFKGKNREDAQELLNTLLSSFAGAEDKYSYNFSLHLIEINHSYKPHLLLSLNNSLFLKANKEFKLRMWLDKLVRYCYINDVLDKYSTGDQEVIEFLNSNFKFEEVFMNNEILLPEVYTKDIQNIILKRLEKAQNNIKIAVAWFTNPKLLNALIKASKRGANVTLVTNNDVINNGGYCLRLDDLIEAGGNIHLAEYPDFVNHKFCLIDNEILITGSYNWTIYAEYINQENILLIEGEGLIETIKEYTNIFNQLCETFRPIDRMPERVPLKPQFDRTSFKQYITEENLFLAKRTRSSEKRDIYYNRACQLSPHHPLIPSKYRTEDKIQTLQRQDVLHNLKSSLENQKHELISNTNIARNEILKKEEEIEKLQQEGSNHELIHELNTSIIQQREQIESIEQQLSTIEDQQNLINSVVDNPLQGKSSKFNIRLEWNTSDDLDLHLKIPNGQEIYYSNKNVECHGCKGYLDVDANAGTPTSDNPQENIFWEEEAPEGDYQVDVNLYTQRSGRKEIPFIVTIFHQNQEPIAKPASFMGLPVNNKPTITMFKFRYSKERGIEIIS